MGSFLLEDGVQKSPSLNLFGSNGNTFEMLNSRFSTDHPEHLPVRFFNVLTAPDFQEKK
jgi:hypothetical protein